MHPVLVKSILGREGAPYGVEEHFIDEDNPVDVSSTLLMRITLWR